MWFGRKNKTASPLIELQTEIKQLEDKSKSLQSQIKFQQTQLSNIEKAKVEAQEELECITFGLKIYGSLEEVGYEYASPANNVTELESALLLAEQELGELITNNNAYITDRIYVIDGKKTKGAKFQEAFGKNLITGFNVYAQNKIKSISVDNYNKTLELIEKAYNKYNKQGELIAIRISPVYLTVMKRIAKIKLDIKILKTEEKEKIRQEKLRLKEQEKLLEELAKEKEKLAKERRYYEAIYGETDSEVKRIEIQERLADIDTREQEINKRANNQKAGWLYVTCTQSMPNMTKIGCSRRWNPLIRLQELSSASVPYPFECKGLVFSENIFELEAQVHNYFNPYRVNKENRHKEFFYVSPEDVIQILTTKFDL